MNYKKIYDDIINKAKTLNRKKSKEQYFELHHIIPRCMGGNNSKTNLVLLTAREHFLCHKLLHKSYPTNRLLFFAYDCMSIPIGQRNIKLSSREFQYIKEMKSKLNDKNSISDKCRQKQREAVRGRKQTEEEKRRRSEANKGKKPSPESIEKAKQTKKKNNYKMPPELLKKRSETIRNKYKNELHFNAKRILFDGVVYDRMGDIHKKLGYCNKTIRKIMDKMISEENPDYKYL